MPTEPLACDGCGQPASPDHIARRLQRLEWTTRYRPVHIAALLLGGVSPIADAEFLYAGRFEGEAGRLLKSVGISAAEKSSESVLSEFQRSGLFLTHVLECPLDAARAGQSSAESLFVQRVSAVMARIRRSLKPKRVVLISEWLTPLAATFANAELGCPVILDNGKPFRVEDSDISEAARHLRAALAAPLTAR
jgi:hypothetical protein